MQPEREGLPRHIRRRFLVPQKLGVIGNFPLKSFKLIKLFVRQFFEIDFYRAAAGDKNPSASEARDPGGIIPLGWRYHPGIPGRHYPVLDGRHPRNPQHGICNPI
jgi:hypothetical protein